MLQWNAALTWIASLSAIVFLVSIVAVWISIVRMPADYFTRDRLPEDSFRYRHPLIRAARLITKNSIGVLLLLAGLVMLVTPGQGILCIFLGVTMVDFPRKGDLIGRMLSRRTVRRMMNRIRARAGSPPLQFPGSAKSPTAAVQCVDPESRSAC